MIKTGYQLPCGVVLGVIAGGAAIVIGIAGAPFTGGFSLAAVAAGAKIIIGSVTVGIGVGITATYLSSKALPEKLKLPMFALSPEEIFQNKVALLDVNFFNPNQYEDMQVTGGEEIEQKSSALILQPIISTWYYALRNLAIVALLSILIYMGIRIIISSSAEDKAKYKQRLLDWLVAMCLLFFMHYIMAFAVTLTEEITKAVGSMNGEYGIIIGASEPIAEEGEGDSRNLKDFQYEDGSDIFGSGEVAESLRKQGIIVDNKDGGELLVWPSNMMGKARIELQLEPSNITDDEILMRQFGYTIIYLALVMYTVLFLFRYLKRLMMLAFLTIIAPLMAMTYPLDKMKDGSAQGFNSWFKEYIYNLLIQPVHLILYTVLIGSALDLVMDNLIYGLVALGFLLQAEKLLRKFFGFDKASTVAGGSALGGALAMQGINQMSKMLGRGAKGDKGGKDNSQNKKVPGGNRKADKDKDADALYGNILGNGSTDNTEPLTSSRGDTPEGQRDMRGDMLNVYDEGFGTDSYDSHEREAMARDAYEPEGMNYSSDEYANILRDSGYSEDEIADMIRTRDGADDGQAGADLPMGEPTLTTLPPEPPPSPMPAPAPEPTVPIAPPTRTSVGSNHNAQADRPRRRRRDIRGNIGKGLAQAGRHAAYIAPRAAKFAARNAVKGTLMGAGAVAGVTAGLVSDDFSNVVKWGGAGLGAGLVAGRGVTSIPDRASGFGDRIIDAAEEEYAATHTKDQVEARQNAIEDAKFLHNKETRKLYQDKLGVSAKEAQKIMKEDAVKYRKYGVTDDKAIIKAMKADRDQFGDSKSSDERILLAKLTSEVSTRKDLDQVEKGLRRRGISEQDTKKYIDTITSFKDW